MQHAEEEVAATDDGPDEFKVLLAKQEVRIKELEGQVAEAAKTAGGSRCPTRRDRAGEGPGGRRARRVGAAAGRPVRNVKAAKALPDGHDGDASVFKR